jgi:hypothetical protein
VAVVFLAVAFSSWRFGDWSGEAENDHLLFQEIQQFLAYGVAVIFGVFSVTCLFWRKRHFDAWLDNTPSGEGPLKGEITRAGRHFDRLFD